MTEESPGKVQALRAMFSEKNNIIMGLMPPGVAKIPNRPWHSGDDNTNVASTALKEKKINEIRLGNKVLPVPEKSPSPFNGDCNGENQTRLLSSKPAIGPKPTHLVQQQLKFQSLKTVNSDGSAHRTVSDAKSKAFGETIASFMFTNNKENENSSGGSNSITSSAPPLPQLPKPRISQLLSCTDAPNSRIVQAENNSQHCNGISTDNYVCKVRRKELPSKEKLGPAPLKPLKPSHMKLPSNLTQPSFSKSQKSDSALLSPLTSPPAPVQKPGSLSRPSYPCPPRPIASPPLPPSSASVIKRNPASLREEIEELYEDTLCGDKKRPVSLIPEYTEEEEHAELYNDAMEYEEENSGSSDSIFKNKKPPPPVPSEYLQPNVNGSNEELYQDADEATQEEFYEIMPCDEIPEEDAGSPLYSNNKREIEKLKKDEEKRIRREQKEKEKREKELEKLRKKFGLTGEEIPIDDGLVKWDSRGGKGDLSVKKGETVLILRMEGNPSGKWLVKNEKGKIGYVELTNIEVDPLSVKSESAVSEDNLCTTPLEKNITWLSKITACVR